MHTQGLAPESLPASYSVPRREDGMAFAVAHGFHSSWWSAGAVMWVFTGAQPGLQREAPSLSPFTGD